MDFTRRIPAKVATVLGTALALACAAPAPADTDTGGAAYGSDSTAQPGRHAMLGQPLRFGGEARPGTKVAVQRLSEGTWETVATATADRRGKYVARWRSQHIGVFSVRAVPIGAGAASFRGSAVEPPVQVTIYKPSVSTWYGRGWEGRKTACGQTLSPGLMGVAHKTLPCGTKVSFLYNGRSITVPVIDRGPYTEGVSWDLTTAAADALGFLATGRGTVGAVALRRP
jgi:rare lipoprotein A (peptidoglycan hydrolase)